MWTRTTSAQPPCERHRIQNKKCEKVFRTLENLVWGTKASRILKKTKNKISEAKLIPILCFFLCFPSTPRTHTHTHTHPGPYIRKPLVVVAQRCLRRNSARKCFLLHFHFLFVFLLFLFSCASIRIAVRVIACCCGGDDDDVDDRNRCARKLIDSGWNVNFVYLSLISQFR